MTYIFPERGKIDKARFILDRSGLVLKTCKIPTASLNSKMLRFFSLSFSEAVHAYSFHTKNFEILTKFSDSMAEKLSMCKILRPYNSQWQKYCFLHINEGTHAMLDMRRKIMCQTNLVLLSILFGVRKKLERKKND